MAETQTTSLDQIMQSYIDSGQYSESELAEIRKREANKLKESTKETNKPEKTSYGTRETSWFKGEEGWIPDEFQTNVNRPEVALTAEDFEGRGMFKGKTEEEMLEFRKSMGNLSQTKEEKIENLTKINKRLKVNARGGNFEAPFKTENGVDYREDGTIIKDQDFLLTDEEKAEKIENIHQLIDSNVKEASMPFQAVVGIAKAVNNMFTGESAKPDDFVETDKYKDIPILDFVHGMFTAADVDYTRSEGVQSGLNIQESLHRGDTPSDEDLKVQVQNTLELAAMEPTDEQRAYGAIYEENKEKFGGTTAWFMAVGDNPTFLTQSTVGSFANIIGTFINSSTARNRAIVGGTAAGGTVAALGQAGPQVAIPEEILTVPTAVLSTMFGAVSGTMEQSYTFTELMKEQLAQDGLDFTAENMQALFADETITTYKDPRFESLNITGTRAEIMKKRAFRRGVAIGFIDTATGMFMGKTGSTVIAPIAGGITSEVAGQTAGGQEYDAGEILTEGVAEKAGPIAITGMTLKALKKVKPGKYKINGQTYSKKKFDEKVNNMSDHDIALANLEVTNDNTTQDQLLERQQNATDEMMVDPKVNNEVDRKKLVDLNRKRKQAKADVDKDGLRAVPGAKENLENIDLQIEEVVNKYASVDGRTKDVKARKKKAEQVSEFVAEKDFQANLEFAKKHSKLYNMTLDDTMSEEQIVEKYGEKARGTNGFVDPKTNSIIVNKEVAKKRGIEGGNVANHELLHGIIAASGVKIKQQTINDFLSNIGVDNAAIIQKRIEDNKDVYTEQYMSENLDEYFTLFSDAIASNEIKFNDNIFTKVKDSIRRVFANLGYSNVNFNDAKSAYNFLKDYNRSIHKGALSSGLKKATKGVGKVKDTKFSINKDQTDSVNELADMGWDNKSWKEQGADFAIKEMQSNKMLDGLIRSKYKADIVPDNFVDLVYSELVSHVKNFKPEQNDNLFGWINSQIANKAGNVYNREFKVADEMKGAKDIGKTTKEGEVKVQVAAETDKAMEILETEDLSPAARAKKKADKAKGKEKVESEFRRKIGIETNSDLYNKVLDSTRKALLRAYETGTSVRNIQRKLRDEANVYLFKSVKNFLGTKDYVKNLKKFREPIVKAIFTADLVQLERNVPDNDRVFTTFVEKLTSKKDVQDAVNQKLLPPSALNIIDKGTAVSVYKKKTPTPDQFLEFFYPPLINPVTGSRSGLRGTRKDGLAKAMAGALSYDAMMEVAQEQDVIEKREQLAALKGETLAQDNLETLSAAIGRDPSIKFSTSNRKANENRVVANMALEIVDLLDAMVTNPTLVIKTKGGYKLNSVNIVKRWTKNSNFAKSDEAIIAEFAYKTYRSNEYGKLTDTNLQKKVLRDIIKARKNKFELSTHQAFEQLIISSLQYANRKAGNVLKTNKKVKEGVGEGDAYISRGRVIVGIEVKMNEADGVSQTVNPKEDGSVSFTNPNPTAKGNVTYDSLMGDMISKATKALSEELGGIQNLKLTANQMITVANNVLKTKYLQVMDISTEYLMWHYGNGKYTNKPQGFIHIGEATYRMITGNAKIDDVSRAIAQEFKNKTGIKIPILKVESGQSMEMVARLKVDKKTGKLNWRISPRIVDKQLVKSNVNLLNKADAVNFMKAATTATSKFSKSQDAQTLGRAIQFSRSANNPTKGISVLDFDDTLATTKSLVKFTRPDGTTGTLNAEQYASTYENLLDQGYTFDFSEFNKVVKGKLAPLFQKALKLQGKFGSENMFVLTARPPAAQKAIFDFLKANGLNIPIKNITGLGNSTAEAKALWMADKVGEGYNDFYFADDALQNVQAVKNMLDQFDVKSKVQQARVDFSNSMNDQFNSMLEDVTGVKSEQEFSDAQARLLGRKAKYKSIIPASAQDFQGLLYNFLGKGKKGEVDMAFFKKALIDPFARAIDELNSSKQSAATDLKNLNKLFPKVKKILNKKIEGLEYTNDQAVRVYLWDKVGFAVPGMTEQDLAALTSVVQNSTEMQAYADAIGLISKREDGYSKPKDYWLAENISSDLLSDGAIGDVRADFLAEWQQNVDQIFSKENLNKIESIYGSKFREALEDSLYRMRTGRNRPTGGGRIMNMYMNWVNNSVGAIMFFNMRSAVLQTISATNYMNWSFNNPAKAALAFANQKQYWKDFTMIFNSSYLKQRRSGNQRGVNEAEISDAVAGSQNKAKAAIAWLLKKGFLPTQLADSFAIASGGAAFFRNKVKALVKEGMTQEQAEKQAFIDFQEVTEVSQQSARPDMISQQQASPLGRLILSFQNTPMQYARIMNKAARDLVNGRGDNKTHISKIAYYGVVQGIIFGALQSALFASLGEDDEEDYDKKTFRIMNQMVDSVLSGIGYGGKAISTVKNTIIEYAKQKNKGWNADHTYTILQVLGFSPPIGSKLRKIYSSIQTDKYNEGVYSKRGFTLDNPIWNAIGNVVEGVTNVPLGRLSNKMLNIDNALDEHHEWWQRAALLLGWNTWDLGIKDPDIEAVKKSNKKKNNKTTKKNKNNYLNDQKREKKDGKKNIKCAAASKSGGRCKTKVEPGSSYCTVHIKVKQNKSGKKVQCKRVKSNKKRCKMKTSSSSGYCYYHD